MQLLQVEIEDVDLIFRIHRSYLQVQAQAPLTNHGRIHEIKPVGRPDEEQVAPQAEVVHHGYEHRRRAVRRPRRGVAAPGAEHGVNLVDDDQVLDKDCFAGRVVLAVGLGLLEQGPDRLLRLADELVEELWPSDELHHQTGVSPLPDVADGPGQEGLAGAGRAVQQHAAVDLAELGELLRSEPGEEEVFEDEGDFGTHAAYALGTEPGGCGQFLFSRRPGTELTILERGTLAEVVHGLVVDEALNQQLAFLCRLVNDAYGALEGLESIPRVPQTWLLVLLTHNDAARLDDIHAEVLHLQGEPRQLHLGERMLLKDEPPEELPK